MSRALGGAKDQLYEMFKELWKEPEVIGLLKRNDIAGLARQPSLLRDWPALKGKIEHIRAQGTAGSIVADLVMAQRIRGGVHFMMPEDDHFQLEALFVGLMRAAALTFAEVRRIPPTSPA